MRLKTVWLVAAYAAFVVYGSLVPLDYRALPLDEALSRFARIRFLDLGVASRADWVANGVLYLPLGFLATRWLKPALGPVLGWAAWVPALALCAALAVGVEFAQLFFPPRTVSQNDLIAEGLGSLLGAWLGLVAGPSLGRLLEGWRAGGHQLSLRLLEVYALAYTVLCFFPFDLLLTGAEVADKWASDLWSPGLALADRGWALSGLQLAVEAALVLPVGMLLAWLRRSTPMSAGMWGLLYGALIEVAQFFIASGVSQGASVLGRGVGMAAGAALLPWLQARGLAGVRDALRRLALPALLVYLPLLLFASGWLRGPSAGLRNADEVASTWAELRWLPFYYHYYTTEALALYSLGSVALMYAPLAVIGWAQRLGRPMVLTGVLAVVTVIEAGKLFLPGQKPDPTNLIIAVAAAAGVLWLAGLAGLAARPAAPVGTVAVAGRAARPVALGLAGRAAGCAGLGRRLPSLQRPPGGSAAGLRRGGVVAAALGAVHRAGGAAAAGPGALERALLLDRIRPAAGRLPGGGGLARAATGANADGYAGAVLGLCGARGQPSGERSVAALALARVGRRQLHHLHQRLQRPAHRQGRGVGCLVRAAVAPAARDG